jgi:glutathione synthase/RimK-type ligase-like ATP-grasp enzyme
VAPPCVLVGPPASRRIAGLQAALCARGQSAASVVDYTDLLAPHSATLALATMQASLVKLEAPGEAPPLHAALIRLGWQRCGEPGPPPRPAAHGELINQHLWFAGFRALLEPLPPNERYLNPPSDLIRMTDKLDCQHRLLTAGVDVPPILGAITGYDDLRDRLHAHRCERAFIKARYGSSGAGVLAYWRRRDGRESAIGPIEMAVEGNRARLFNSIRQRRYDDRKDIARLVDALAEQHAYAERWIAKPAVPGSRSTHFDVRIVMLDGKPRQRIARASRWPLTNLHLGNCRLPVESVLTGESITALESAASAACAAFPASRMIGLDVIVRGARVWVLEANGFGDLLHGVQWQGQTTYDDQAELIARCGHAHG